MKSVVMLDDKNYDKWLLEQRDTVTPVWAKTTQDLFERCANPSSFDKSIRNQPSSKSDGLFCGPQADVNQEKMGETVGGTVSRKGKFGFTCESCLWVPAKGGIADWVPGMFGRYVGLHFPERCKVCKARMKRYTCAARNYDRLELLRILRGRQNLKFVTWTRPEWNVKVDLHATSYQATPLWGEAEKLKKIATRQFRNWRTRNKYWKSREATGQCYYEVTMKPVWKGWGWDEVQLHFHIHSVVCSKRIENQDIQVDLDTLEQIPMSTTIQREWGGIVDVRKCRTWKHKDGETKTSKRFVIRYLVDYITKSAHWQSTKFGDWSN